MRPEIGGLFVGEDRNRAVGSRTIRRGENGPPRIATNSGMRLRCRTHQKAAKKHPAVRRLSLDKPTEGPPYFATRNFDPFSREKRSGRCDGLFSPADFFAMPNTASAKKRLRQNDARRLRNRSQKSSLRSQLRKVREAVESGDRETATNEFRVAQKRLDQAAAKKLIHPNAAARTKSRLSKLVKSAG